LFFKKDDKKIENKPEDKGAKKEVKEKAPLPAKL